MQNQEIRQKPICLTIAGSDPSSGAGIQADLKAFEANNVYGMTVITALTVQTAAKVSEWVPVDPNLVQKQLTTLLENYSIGWAKTGMLPSKVIIDIVAEAKKKYGFKLIVDPVFVSSSGARLIEPDVEDYYIKTLFPISEYITPNKMETERLTGVVIENPQTVIQAGKKFHEMGVQGVLFKGGHVEQEKDVIIDYLYHPEDFVDINLRPRRQENNQSLDVHGTGCNLSAAFCAWMAHYDNAFDAMIKAEDYMGGIMTRIIEFPNAGKVADSGRTAEEMDSMNMVAEVYNFISKIQQASELIPEVRMNISAAAGDATYEQQVAGIEGRITVVNGYPRAAGQIKMGASNHTARLLIAAKKHEPEIRIVMNIKWTADWISKIISKTDFRIHKMNRKEESQKTREQEQSTMQWAVEDAWKIVNRIPDIIWDDGEFQKEPMIRLFAYDVKDCIEKLKIILNICTTWAN